MTDKQFDAEDIVGVLVNFDPSRKFIAKMSQFKNWQKLGAFGEKTGKGRKRFYHGDELIVACALNELCLLGVSPQNAINTLAGFTLSWDGFAAVLPHSASCIEIDLAPYKEAFTG